MAKGTFTPEWQRAIVVLSAATVAVIIVTALYWARSIFIPVALAIFLAFVLAPVVSWFQRRGLGRTPAVILTVGLAVVLTAGTATVMAQQISGLLTEMAKPERAAAMKGKLIEIRTKLAGGESHVGQMFDDLADVLFPKRTQKEPMPVVIQSDAPPWMNQLEQYISPATEGLGQAAFAFILTVYMLLRREDLRNRMIRLLGHGQVTTTTKGIDDASKRISKYLLAQLMLNTAFGLVIVLGLLVIGVKYALLWGFLATVMRYIPYIGTWIGLIPPTLFAFALSDGPNWWLTPTLTLALFLGLEALCNNIFEPWLYGASMGLSEVAQLVAAGFWAFLWGPIGLILSGPLTVCLLVLGKYVSRFRFLEVLLGDEPALEPRVAFYQRLAARDQDEAADVALAAAKDSTPEAVYDAVVIPGLCLAKRDHATGELSEDSFRFALRAAREVAEEVAGVNAEEPAAAGDAADRVPVLLYPARDEADHVAVELLGRLLEPGRWEVRVLAVDTLVSELLAAIADVKPAAVVIGALPPGGLAHARYVVARVKARFPDLKVVVGRWGRGDDLSDEGAGPAGIAGADWVDDTVAETHKRLTEYHSVFAATPADSAPVDATGKTRTVGTAGASV
jgi:predicted PurR-regulated permease PerM